MKKPEWDKILSGFKYPSFLQSWEWGEQKMMYGWEKDFLVWRDETGQVEAAAMVLSREHQTKLFGIKTKILYIPHGPLVDWNNDNLRRKVLGDLKKYVVKNHALYIKLDPQIITAVGIKSDENYREYPESQKVTETLKSLNWVKSKQEIQFRNTFWIDLSYSEDELLARMKQKTRYNIRLASRKGVGVRILDKNEIKILYKMYLETSRRDGFIIRPESYYMDLLGNFISAGYATPLIAEKDGDPVAGLFLFHFHKKSYYFYGMSLDKHRDKMPNYLLQWEAIKHSKKLDCEIYDLWGAPEVFNSSDDMWGVYRFKQGLGGNVVQTIGAYDYPSDQFKYTILQSVFPKVQSLTRFIRRKQIKKEIET